MQKQYPLLDRSLYDVVNRQLILVLHNMMCSRVYISQFTTVIIESQIEGFALGLQDFLKKGEFISFQVSASSLTTEGSWSNASLPNKRKNHFEDNQVISDYFYVIGGGLCSAVWRQAADNYGDGDDLSTDSQQQEEVKTYLHSVFFYHLFCRH